MEETCVLRPIAHVHSEFPGKFGIPRQSGVVPELRSELIFTPEFRNPDALRIYFCVIPLLFLSLSPF